MQVVDLVSLLLHFSLLFNSGGFDSKHELISTYIILISMYFNLIQSLYSNKIILSSLPTYIDITKNLPKINLYMRN